MTDGTNDPGRDDTTDSVAEETTDASRGGWQQFAQRADDEKRPEGRKKDAETAGTSPAPDVDLLADSLGSLADTISGHDTDEERRTR